MTTTTGRRYHARVSGRTAWLVAVLLATACDGGTAGPDAVDLAPAGQSQGTVQIQATWTSYQLPSAISGEVAVAQGTQILIGGGNTAQGTPLGAIVRLDPVTGQTRPAGRLRQPVTDAGAAMLHGRLIVFGGRATRTIASTQAAGPGLPAQAAGPGHVSQASGTMIRVPGSASMLPVGTHALGRLPQARAGMAAVTAGQVVYLVGGVNGTSGATASTVLRTTDGVHYSVAATLPVAVSYPGVVVQAGSLWVFGGRTSGGGRTSSGGRTSGDLTDVIQQVELNTGRSRVAGRLPRPLAAESAFILRGEIFLAGGETTVPNASHTLTTSATVLRYAPGSGVASGAVSVVGVLPLPTAHAASAVIHDTAYLLGGTDGPQTMPAVVAVRLLPAAKPGAPSTPGSVNPPGGQPPPRATARSMPWLAPAHGRGHLVPGSHPWAMPADVLVADHLNNRLVIIDPQGRIRWVFPRPGDLARGQTFLVPDDAFFSADGRYIVATQEDDQVISVIDVATRKIVYRYGKPGTPGMGRNRVHNPDDAMLLPGGDIIAADIMNCRFLLIAPPAHRPHRIFGQSTNICLHDPPYRFGSPNGAFPVAGGGYVVTEINGDWADGISRSGRLLWSTNPPGVSYPSDTNQVSPGRYLTADYSDPGQVVEFTKKGRLLWRFGGLNQPSLALPLPNGYVVLNDDFNHRIIVVNPANNHILWQYGHTGIPGRGPGYLDDPDGLDLVPPDSFLARQAATAGRP